MTELNIPEDLIAFPDGVETRPIDIMSDGTRLSGDLFYRTGLSPGENRPVPAPDSNGEVTVTARAIRELVDPVDQTRDITSCMDYLSSEPGVDPNRIGLWGTSYGGGHAVYVAAHDDRVKCLVAQASSQDSRGIGLLLGGVDDVRKDAGRRARGEIDAVPQGEMQFPGLEGSPYINRQAFYAPVAHAHKVRVPTFVIDTEKEELMNPAEHGGLVYERIKGNAPAKYKVFKGMTHYEIYERGLAEARQLAIDWFNEHL